MKFYYNYFQQYKQKYLGRKVIPHKKEIFNKFTYFQVYIFFNESNMAFSRELKFLLINKYFKALYWDCLYFDNKIPSKNNFLCSKKYIKLLISIVLQFIYDFTYKSK